MWSSRLLWLSFAVCYSSSLARLPSCREQLADVRSQLDLLKPLAYSLIMNMSTCHASLGAMESQVKLLEPEVKSLKMEAKTCHANLSAMESQVKRLEPEVKSLKMEAKTCQANLGAMESQNKLLETEIKSLIMKARNSSGLPMDCVGHMEAGYKKSGIYRILPIHSTIDAPFEVYCDMETDGGGWTVFQRRDDYGEPRQDFYLDWYSYKRGFGNLSKEFWLGNDKLYALTNQKKVLLRVDLEDFEGERRYAEYSRFFVDSERALYTATFGTYRGNAGDSLIHHANNTAFSTKDKDNDKGKRVDCANVFKGGWWYGACHSANLNGLYLKGKHESYADGIEWYEFKGVHYSLKFSEMKIRPVDYKSGR